MDIRINSHKQPETKAFSPSLRRAETVQSPTAPLSFFSLQQYVGNQAVQERIRAGEIGDILISSLSDSQRIQRHEATRHYRGCSTEDENFFVEQAQTRAPVWVAMTIADLGSLPSASESVPHIQSVLNRFFHPPAGGSGRIGGTHRPETIRQIISHLESMHHTLTNPSLFRCVTRETCARETMSHRPDAYAYAGFRTEISICPNFFTLPQNSRLSTLVHESAHQIGLMQNVIPRTDVLQLNLRAALRNAESYALLVEENMTGPPIVNREPESTYGVEGETGGWNPSFAHCELFLQEPVESTFCQEGPDCRLLSSFQTGLESPFEAPFPGEAPIRFRGNFHFFVDTIDRPIPEGRPLPTVHSRILFTPDRGSPRILLEQTEENPEYPSGFPGNPLEFSSSASFSPFFNFALTENGRLEFTCSLVDFGLPEAEAIMTGYNETIRVMTRHDI